MEEQDQTSTQRELKPFGGAGSASREECEERVEVQYAGVKHGKFGVPTPPNSGSELSSRKVAVAAILESSAGSKRRCPDGQDPIFNMNSTSTEPRV